MNLSNLLYRTMSTTATNLNKIKFISIEGNIGAGKSTLFAELKKYVLHNNIQHKVVFIDEPLEIWESIIDPSSGKTIFELYYENAPKWAFTFQTMVFASQQKYIKHTLNAWPECSIVISERSVESGRNIFTRMIEESGYINPIERQVYDLLFESNQYPLHMSIFIDTPPSVCFERIHKRARKGEDNITIEYLNHCDSCYRKWLIEEMEAPRTPEIVNVVENNSLETVLPILLPYFNTHKHS
jgi:deoxyadenosine/deoxycytidine kinase